jgi:hypothetical protein
VSVKRLRVHWVGYRRLTSVSVKISWNPSYAYIKLFHSCDPLCWCLKLNVTSKCIASVSNNNRPYNLYSKWESFPLKFQRELHSTFIDKVESNCHFPASGRNCYKNGFSWFYCFRGAILDTYRENLVALGGYSCSSSRVVTVSFNFISILIITDVMHLYTVQLNWLYATVDTHRTQNFNYT